MTILPNYSFDALETATPLQTRRCLQSICRDRPLNQTPPPDQVDRSGLVGLEPTAQTIGRILAIGWGLMCHELIPRQVTDDVYI